MDEKLDRQAKETLQELMGERFVHSLSNLIYNSTSTLWHIDEKSEKDLSHIASKVVAGVFCFEYLSHLNTLLNEKLGIEEHSDRDLADDGKLKELRRRLSGDCEYKRLAKEILPLLKRLVDSVGAEDLEKVTSAAHTGDYLLSSLEDLNLSNDPDYSLWLHSTPHYYKRDLDELSMLNRPEGLHTDDGFAR